MDFSPPFVLSARGEESSVLALGKKSSIVGSSGDSIAPSAEVGVRLVDELLLESSCVISFKAGERKSRSTRPENLVASIGDCTRCRKSWSEPL